MSVFLFFSFLSFFKKKNVYISCLWVGRRSEHDNRERISLLMCNCSPANGVMSLMDRPTWFSSGLEEEEEKEEGKYNIYS